MSSSPSFPKAVSALALVEFLFFPILCMRYLIKCAQEDRSEWIGFFLLLVFGLAELTLLALRLLRPEMVGKWVALTAAVAYVATLWLNLRLRATMSDEALWSRQKTAA